MDPRNDSRATVQNWVVDKTDAYIMNRELQDQDLWEHNHANSTSIQVSERNALHPVMVTEKLKSKDSRFVYLI
jgi:hypothetical protein